MSPRFPLSFIRWSCAILFFTAGAKLYSATGNAKVLNAADPFFTFANRHVMIGVGVIELGIAAYLLLGKNPLTKFFTVLWLSSNFLLYRLANYLAGNTGCPCLGNMFEQLGVDADTMNFALMGVVIYLLAGSIYCLRQHLRPAAEPAGQPVEV